MNADQSFLDQLTDECQTKAEDWDQRSKTRAGELKALSEALEALESGAADQYSANKKLNLVQKTNSFLQLRGTTNEALKVAATMRAESLLMKTGQDLQSPILSIMSMKVKLAADHFVKVRGLIKDLIERLENDAEAEATQKGFCDKKMKAAVEKRDAANGAIEVAVSEISKLTNLKAQLESEVQDLKQAIADNLKALNEATELRESEKEENTVTIETAKEGQAAVELALSILKQFYENAFIQTGYTPPDSDREGLTVADRAPETFSGSYHGNQDASKGIIGLLDVILSDFERTVSTTDEEEKTAQGAFEVFESDIKKDNAAKDTEIKTKEGDIATAEDDLVEQGEDKDDATKLLEDAKAELKKLKPLVLTKLKLEPH
jgi:predicted  nucleic acid-binding Zn-ribbon protein